MLYIVTSLSFFVYLSGRVEWWSSWVGLWPMTSCVFRRMALCLSMISLVALRDTSAWAMWECTRFSKGCIRDSILITHCFFKSVLIYDWAIALILLQEVSQSQVLDTKIFHSPYGTGVAILTGALRFTLATNIDDIKLRRLPEVPGK